MPRRNYDNKSSGRDERRSYGDSKEMLPSRKRMCRFCADKQLKIDFKDGKALKAYMSEREKITPARITGLCAFHQRRMTEAIKRARIMGLLPFSASQRETI
ncbi:MAG: 30S ribosomal protein S18 [Deltaproteobacteria bacterium]|nr:30S ribosomal protein S18 [Deltaproteobacteria bacterium]